MGEQVKNTIVVLEPSAKSANELLQVLADKNVANIIKVSTTEEAIQNIANSLPCMFIASINSNQDVPARVQLFKRLESSIKHNGLKVYVVTPIKNRQLADMITQKMGVSDYITEPVPVRTMQFKANLQLKAVDSFRRQQEMKKASEEKVVIKKLDNGRKVDASGNEVKTNGKPALQTGDDTFLFKNSGVRKAGKKFTVELEGPDPSTGEWTPHEDKGNAKTAWRWVPNEEKEKQAKGEMGADGWVHEGEKPLFNENSQKWSMTSENPSLSLMAKGKLLAKKIGTDEAGEVFVAEDSPAAEENLRKNRARAAEEKAKKELAKKSTKEGAEKAPAEAKSTAEAEEKLPAARPEKKGAAPERSATLRSLLGEEEEEGANAGDLNDRRGPAAARAAALRNKRATLGKSDADEVVLGSESESAADADEDEKNSEKSSADAPSKRLDRKKLKGGDADKNADAEFADRTDEGESAAPAAIRDRRAKDKADRLSGLRDKLGEAEENSEPEGQEENLYGDREEGEGAEEAGLNPSKGNAKRRGGKAEALREDPASRKAELRDHQGNPNNDKLRALREARVKKLAEVKALLEDPLPEHVSAEEEAALRDELGLKGRPEIKAKDLVRKKRLKTAMQLKERLAQLDEEISSTPEGEALHALSADEVKNPERHQGDLNPDKLKGIRGAYDSDAGQEGESEEDIRKRLKNKLEETRRQAARQEKAQYLPEADVQPLGNAWENAGAHYVYIAAGLRVRGFQKLDDLFPLWIFEGEDLPQLLDKTKQWRFLGNLPFQARTVADVPIPVRDFLLGLRDQLQENEAGKTTPKKRDGADLLSEFADEDASDRANEENSADSENIRGKKSNRADGGDNASTESASGSADAQGEEEESLRGGGALGEDKETGAEGEASLDKDRANARNEGDDLENTKERSKNGDAPPSDELARLRARLGAADDKETEAEATAEEAARKRAQQGDQADSESVAALEKSKSEGVQKFLARHKKKMEEGAPEPLPRPTAADIEPAPGYLGIYVAVSDAYGHRKKPGASLSRVLGSLEDSFGNCEAYITALPDAGGQCDVLFQAPRRTSALGKLDLKDGVSIPIEQAHGEAGQSLGYLYLRATSPRTRFDEGEEKALRGLGDKLWPLVQQARNAHISEEAA